MSTFASLPAVLSPPLPDREAVIDALYRCCLAWDTNDQALSDTVFTPDAVLTLNGASMTGLDEIRNKCNALIFTLDTTHLVGNLRVTFPTNAPDRMASITATVIAQHFARGKGFDLAPEGGREGGSTAMMNHNRHLMSGTLYSGDLVKDRTDGLWKFSMLTIHPNWVEGHFSVVGGRPIAGAVDDS